MLCFRSASHQLASFTLDEAFSFMLLPLQQCALTCFALLVLRMPRARSVSSAVPCTSMTKPSALMARSYSRTVSFGIPMLARAAARALAPPTIAAPSIPARTIAAKLPSTTTGPIFTMHAVRHAGGIGVPSHEIVHVPAFALQVVVYEVRPDQVI